MMNLVPININGCVVINAVNVCKGNDSSCGLCSDYAVAIHNWMMATDLKYLVFDFQDEKDVCHPFLEEVLQLWKRMKIPFLFSGLVEKPKVILSNYGYFKFSDTFTDPEEAVAALRQSSPELIDISFDGVLFNRPILLSKSRQTVRYDDNGELIEEEETPAKTTK